MSELKDCPLQFHDFKSVDHLKVCPRYTAVLARSEDDGIGIEELDTLQLELETLLSSASRRLRVLEAETQILTDWQDKKGDRRFLKLSRDHELGAPPKHGKPKKQKLEGKTGHGPGPGPGRPKSKNVQPKIQEYEFTDDPIDVPRIPKNDAPNRFWASVEPYCADITSEEVRTLEELLKPPEDEAEHYKVETESHSQYTRAQRCLRVLGSKACTTYFLSAQPALLPLQAVRLSFSCHLALSKEPLNTFLCLHSGDSFLLSLACKC